MGRLGLACGRAFGLTDGVGKRLCLQLKTGNSHLTKRKTDGAEIFTIRKQRWVEVWMNRPWPVMLVTGTSSEEDVRANERQKVEFADVRWIEITSVLRRESANGMKPVKQIEFKAERLDMSSVRTRPSTNLRLFPSASSAVAGADAGLSAALYFRTSQIFILSVCNFESLRRAEV